MMNDGDDDSNNNSTESLATPPVSVQVITDALTTTVTQETLSDAIAQNEALTVNEVDPSNLVSLTSTDTATDNEDTKDGKFVIVTPSGTATLGVGTLEPLPEVDTVSGEPAYKRYRMQGEDGQSYILTMATDPPENSTDTKQFSEHQYQAKQAELTSETAAARNLEKRNQLLKSDISQAWFTTRDDKYILQSSGATWKQGQWTKDEIELLQMNISDYCRSHNISDPTEIIFEMTKDDRKQFYRTIAKGLQRPLFSVYRRVTRMYDQKNHMGKYSYDEKVKLKELRAKHGNDWATIGQALGRSASSVKDKCRLMKETCNSGKWLPEEEKRLTQAVYDLTGGRPGEDIVHGLSWALVAEKVITRSEKQCRTKWLNYMNWKMKGGKEWTREEDMNLIIRVAGMEVTDDTEIDWDELARNWESARSPQWLRGKWWSLKRHIPDYQILPFNELLESMKTFYLHYVRIRNSANSTARTRKIVSSAGQTLQYVPIALNGLSTVDASGIDEMDSNVAYEVLQELQELPNSGGSYIITQSGVSQSLQTSLSEHIIVQTVPASQMSNSDLELPNESRVVIRVPSASDLSENSLETSDLGTTIQLPETIDHGQQDLESLTEEHVISQPVSLAVDSTFPTHGLEEAVISSPGDVVIDIKQESYSQSASNNGQLMTSFSDPMLNSDSISLMGSASDVETELVQMSS
ncbi:cyclin-D-binding Myb-like transcription factor 1 [Mercenaria mercenaria]|uniref:cyclin-D-binding Myb-like transcription factor 1 n=1 Tax=Mercenaria mercenaria TaxID=6596 RepID=UPI001E1E0D57|nr:cyclin-D-binding Myb-like transcription factor 1 [Mercenaria mercenaria]